MVATVQNLEDPVAFVLGEDTPYVKWDDLSPDQRLAVVSEVREWVRPLLSTLPGFKTLSESIEETCHVEIDDLERAGSWGWEQRCRLVMRISLGELGIPGSDLRDVHSQQHYLSTDRDGNWFVVAVFNRLSYFSTTTNKLHPRAFRVTCLPITDRQLTHLASSQGRVLYLALKKLLAAARGYWQQRMVEVDIAEERIIRMEERIV